MVVSTLKYHKYHNLEVWFIILHLMTFLSPLLSDVSFVLPCSHCLYYSIQRHINDHNCQPVSQSLCKCTQILCKHTEHLSLLCCLICLLGYSTVCRDKTLQKKWKRKHQTSLISNHSFFSVCFFLQAACPVLCSGNGQYDKGSCICYSGWKGPECDVPISQCIDPQCGGHGTCTEGTCVCTLGYKGENCAEGKRVWVCVIV